jgi:hypothetical protein
MGEPYVGVLHHLPVCRRHLLSLFHSGKILSSASSSACSIQTSAFHPFFGNSILDSSSMSPFYESEVPVPHLFAFEEMLFILKSSIG